MTVQEWGQALADGAALMPGAIRQRLGVLPGRHRERQGPTQGVPAEWAVGGRTIESDSTGIYRHAGRRAPARPP